MYEIITSRPFVTITLPGGGWFNLPLSEVLGLHALLAFALGEHQLFSFATVDPVLSSGPDRVTKYAVIPKAGTRQHGAQFDISHETNPIIGVNVATCDDVDVRVQRMDNAIRIDYFPASADKMPCGFGIVVPLEEAKKLAHELPNFAPPASYYQ